LALQKNNNKWDYENKHCPICQSKLTNKDDNFICVNNEKHAFNIAKLGTLYLITRINSNIFHKWVIKEQIIYEINRRDKIKKYSKNQS
jgi:hypothetical protein